MRRSAASQQVARPWRRRRRRPRCGQRVEGEDLDRGVVRRVGPRRGSRRAAARRRRRRPRRPWRPAGTRRARPARRRRRRGATRSPLRAPPAPPRPARAPAGRARGAPGRAPPGARRRWPRPSRSRARRVAAPVVVVAGLALRASEARELVGLGLLEAEPSRRLRRATDVEDGVVEPVLEPGQLAEHRVAADVQPRVVDLPAASARPGRRPRRCALAVTGRDRGSGGEQPVRGLVPRPVQPVVERAAAIGQLHRSTELAVVRDDVGEVVAAARLQVDVVGRVGQLGGRGDVVAGELEVTRRRLDPRREQERAGPVPGRGRVAGRVERGQDPLRASAVAEDDPGPAEPVDDARARAAGRARRSRPGRRRCWRARPGRRRGARPGGRCAPLRWRTRRASANQAACAARARSVSPASAIASSANARMLSSSR